MQLSESFLQDVAAEVERNILSRLHVMMPGRIASYDPSTGLADIQPALMRHSCAGAFLPAPLLLDVPVFRPAVDFSLSPGDPCLVLFADFCLEGVWPGLQPVVPLSPRAHDLSDAIALAGFFGPAPEEKLFL
ncbi:MAG: hypothetical protein IJ153_04445 [Clostridia bacterium]|nr:hypothetical protein [Clostridia bacterium]